MVTPPDMFRNSVPGFARSPDARLERADMPLGMFRAFYHHDLFIDCAKCDLAAIRKLVKAELTP